MITIILPDEIEHYAGDLEYFFQSMMKKLYLNRDKGFGDNVTPIQMMNAALKETDELRDALLHKDQFTAYFEAVDVANFAFLCALVTGRMTRRDYEAIVQNKVREKDLRNYTISADKVVAKTIHLKEDVRRMTGEKREEPNDPIHEIRDALNPQTSDVDPKDVK